MGGKKKRYQKNVIFHLTPSSKRSITFRCSEFYELPSDLLPKEKEDITRYSRQRILNSLVAFQRIEALSVHAHITTAFCLRVEDKQSKIKKVKKKRQERRSVCNPMSATIYSVDNICITDQSIDFNITMRCILVYVNNVANVINIKMISLIETKQENKATVIILYSIAWVQFGARTKGMSPCQYRIPTISNCPRSALASRLSTAIQTVLIINLAQIEGHPVRIDLMPGVPDEPANYFSVTMLTTIVKVRLDWQKARLEYRSFQTIRLVQK